MRAEMGWSVTALRLCAGLDTSEKTTHSTRPALRSRSPDGFSGAQYIRKQHDNHSTPRTYPS